MAYCPDSLGKSYRLLNMKVYLDKFSSRFSVIAILLALVGLVIVGKSLYIMTVKKDYWMAVNDRFQRRNVSLTPMRGNILADDGEVLAASLPEYKMYMDFMVEMDDSVRKHKEQLIRDSLLTVKMDSICQGMHRIFPDIDPAKLAEHLREGRRKKSKNWPVYPKRVSYIQYRRVKQLPLLRLAPYRGGFHVETFRTRVNPFGALAPRTVGDLYRGKDEARSGIEKTYDAILRGKPGRYHRQKVLNQYLSIVDLPAEDGCDVQTTLNIAMQDITQKALGDRLREIQGEGRGQVNFGVAIVMDVKTGDVKAISSLSRVGDGSFQEISNKAVSNLMEPGSVFKPMSFLVAFNDGFLHLNDQVDTGYGIIEMHGRKMKDHNWRNGGYGRLTARMCIANSSNVGVSKFIDRFYGNNPDKFVDGIYAAGVGEDLRIPIPGYAKPRIRRPRDLGDRWAKTDLPWMSIGYVTQIPPISTLTFYNGIANDGKMMRPRFIKAILRNGEVIEEKPPIVVREQMAKPEAIKDLQACLRAVVTDGVGRKINSKLFHISGKTGTAQVWTAHGRSAEYLVSFAGYFPSEAPRYSCIVCIEKAGSAGGALDCGPVFKRIAETVMAQDRLTDYTVARDSVNIPLPIVNPGNILAANYLLDVFGIPHSTNVGGNADGVIWGTCATRSGSVSLANKLTPKDEMPDVRGYGLRDAVFRLEQAGLLVNCAGIGRVTAQSIPPGAKIKHGEHVNLILGEGAEVQEMAATEEEAATEPAQQAAPENATPATTNTPAPTPKPEKPQAKPAKEGIKPEKPKVTNTEKPKDKPKEPARTGTREATPQRRTEENKAKDKPKTATKDKPKDKPKANAKTTAEAAGKSKPKPASSASGTSGKKKESTTTNTTPNKGKKK